MSSPLSYQGKPECRNVTCTRRPNGECMGWHCPICDEPVSYQGHDCPKGEPHRITADTRIAPGSWACLDCPTSGGQPSVSPVRHAEAWHQERWGVGVVVVADEAHRGSEGS